MSDLEVIAITVLSQAAALSAFFGLAAFLTWLVGKLPDSKIKRLLLWSSDNSRSGSVSEDTANR